jgi:hypothetical protein
MVPSGTTQGWVHSPNYDQNYGNDLSPNKTTWLWLDNSHRLPYSWKQCFDVVKLCDLLVVFPFLKIVTSFYSLIKLLFLTFITKI